MSANSNISWTDNTWPIIAGCSYESPGCSNCWAVRDSWRLAHNPNPKVHNAYFGTVDKTASGALVWSGIVRTLPQRLDWPLKWRGSKRVFVCSQSDLAHPKVPFDFIAAAFGVMAMAPQHTFQVLTKHARRMREFFEWLDQQQGGPLETCLWHARQMIGAELANRHDPYPDKPPEWPLENVWLGVTVEDQKRADERIPELLRCPARLRWLSVEPMLETIDLRRWLNASSWHGSESLQSGIPGLCRDTRGRQRLEGGSAAQESVGWARSHRADESTSDRSNDQQGLSHRQSDDRLAANEHPCSSARLAPPTGTNPGGVNDQSQKRHQDGQQDRQPGTSDLPGANQACGPRFEDRANGEPERGDEPRGQIESGRCNGNPETASTETAALGDCEALRGRVQGDLENCARPALASSKLISWLVVGGESAQTRANTRPFDLAWARDLRDQCKAAGVAYFLKQLGSKPIFNIEGEGPVSDLPPAPPPGKTSRYKWHEPQHWPEDLRVQEFPG